MKWFGKHNEVEEQYVAMLQAENAALREKVARLEMSRKVVVERKPKFSWEQRRQMLAGQLQNAQVQAILDQTMVEWNQYCATVTSNGAPQSTIDGARGGMDALGLMILNIENLTADLRPEEVKKG